jgi:hypothetical protein
MPTRPVVQNPFDFSNPVTDASVLAGRERVLEQAHYYLDQSREGGSYSLALIGERASGKTSLLNALHDYAATTDLVAAHIRLDEAVAADDLDFFREVFHSLMESCARRGLFGGQAGAEFDTFCRQVLTHDLDTDRAYEPLAFGRVYATARAQDRAIPLSRRMLLSDINTIVQRSRDADLPAVLLLIDEADVLAENHALLQTLRNLLMDSSHFSIIAAGTEKMFPAISDVFSPVPRQFVRINVEPFREWEDTRRAIRRRLALAGQDWAMPTNEICQEIHSLTQGKPYEVMLVSHFAYRERTRAAKQRVPMNITPGVMADVASQLQQQNPAVQQTLSQLQGLNATDAHTIRQLIELDGVSVDKFAISDLDFNSPYSDGHFMIAKKRVIELLDRLGSTGFVAADEGRVRVKLDSFQRALVKYVVLGRPDSQPSRIPDLDNPRLVIPRKVRDALELEVRRVLELNESTDVVSEIHFQNDRLSRRLAFDPELALDEFHLQASCVIGTADKVICVVVVRGNDTSEVRAEVIADAVIVVRERLMSFDVVISDIEVKQVDTEAVEGLRNIGSDPLDESVTEAMQSFWVGSQDMEKHVKAACKNLSEADPRDDTTRQSLLNNCAFMALGIAADTTYLELSDRAEALSEPLILTVVTRALWEACHGNYEAALERLDFDEDELAQAQEIVDCIMYSPAALARDEPIVVYEDLIGDVDLLSVVASYSIAIEARKNGEPIANALGNLPNPAPWLLGIAADSAAIEGRTDLEKALRRRAAESVGDSGDEGRGRIVGEEI